MAEEMPHEDAGFEDPGYAEDTPQEKAASKNSVIVMCLGCILFPACLVLLGWNEKTTVCEENMIMQAEGNSISADCDDADAVQGQIVFFSCPIKADSLTVFTPLNFNTPGLQDLIKFRSVAASARLEMFQCIETKEERELEDVDTTSFLEMTGRQLANASSTLEFASDSFTGETRRRRTKPEEEKGKVTTYRYNMGWADAHYDSRTFKGTPENIQASGCPDFIYNGEPNHNPEAPDRGDGEKVSLGTQVVHAPSVQAGVFTFNDEAGMQSFETNHPVQLDVWKDSFGLRATTDNIVSTVVPNALAVHEDSPTYLSSCAHDRLGCIRLSYNASDATHISVLGKVGASGNVEPIPTKTIWGCSEGPFIRMFPEEMTKEDMIARMKGTNQARSWAIRLVGLLFCWLSVWCCLEPIASAGDAVGDVLSQIPLGEALESLLDGVMDLVVCFMACSCGCCFGLLVIAIVWIAMRPIVGAPLMGGCLVLFICCLVAQQCGHKDPKRMRKRKQMGPGYGATGAGGESMMYA